MKKFFFPPIGMRIIKSAAAVFMTIILSELRPNGMPVYASMTAIICIQNSHTDSFISGINRIIGTFAGACFGLLTLLLIRHVAILSADPWSALLISVMTIFIIYAMVLLKQSASSSLTCVVFLSIIFSSSNQLPQFAALNRFIDTMIGIIVSYLINGVWSFRRRNLHTLFVTAFDGVLAGADGTVSDYAKVNLNRMLEKKAAVTVASYRTPAVLLPALDKIQFRLPFIVMNGAAVYDLQGHSIPYYVSIPDKVSRIVLDTCRGLEVQCYKYAIVHDELHVYYDDVYHPAMKKRHRELTSHIYQSSVRGEPPEIAEMLYFFFVGEDGSISKIEEKLRGLPESCLLDIIREAQMDHPGFSNLAVTSAMAGVQAAAGWLMQREGYGRLVVFGRGEADIPLLTIADRGFCMKESVPAVQALGLPCAGSNVHDDVVRNIHRLLYRHDLERELPSS